MIIELVKNENGSFLPAFDSDKELVDKIGVGEIRRFNVKKDRSGGFHRKFFALLKLALHYLPEAKKKEAFDFSFRLETVNDLLLYLKLKLKYYDNAMITKSGEIIRIPASISFDSMGEDEFRDFYNKSLDVILVLIDADRELIETELNNFL